MRNRSYVYATLSLLLLAATAMMVGCGGDSQSTVFQNVSERTSWSSMDNIAFASFGGNGLLYVYSINTQGRGLTLLTLTDNDDDLNDEGGRHPAYSPNAGQIAISARRGATPAIYLIDAERGDREAERCASGIAHEHANGPVERQRQVKDQEARDHREHQYVQDPHVRAE